MTVNIYSLSLNIIIINHLYTIFVWCLYVKYFTFYKIFKFVSKKFVLLSYNRHQVYNRNKY